MKSINAKKILKTQAKLKEKFYIFSYFLTSLAILSSIAFK